jgi:hypothetical protein
MKPTFAAITVNNDLMASNTESFVLRIRPGVYPNGLIRVVIINQSNVTFNVDFATPVIYVQQWQLVSFIFNHADPNFVKMYVNGVEYTGVKSGPGTNNIRYDTFIYLAGNSGKFIGGMAYMGIHTGNMTLAEHQEMYNGGNPLYPKKIIDTYNGGVLIAQEQPAVSWNSPIMIRKQIGLVNGGGYYLNTHDHDLHAYP